MHEGGDGLRSQERGDVIVQVPPLSDDRLYAKEQSLIDLVPAEPMEGRLVLVYVTHTGTKDITGRMDDTLIRHGFRVAVMKSEAVGPERREGWVADRVKQGIDVLICHLRLASTLSASRPFAGQAEHLALLQPLPPYAQGEARLLSSPCAGRRIVRAPHSVWAG